MRTRTASLGLAVAIWLCFSAIIVAQTTRQPQKRRATEPLPPIAEPTPAAVDTIKIDINLVTVPVIASDSNGVYVPDLRQEEFGVLEDGVKQTITFFATLSTPFHVVLMLDTSASTEEKLSQIQRAAAAFIEQLRPADRVKVISFADEVCDLGEFTKDRAALRTAILKTRSGQGTKLYDAFEMALNSISSIQGRKAIILFTDGVDWHSAQATFDSTLHNLDEEGVIVYPIRYDTRADTERIAREQSEGSGAQLPTIGVIRTPPAGTTAPTFPSDDPNSVPTRGTRTNGGILGLPSPGEILRRTREPYPPNGPPTSDPPPPDTGRRKTPGPLPDPRNDPGGTSRPSRRSDDSVTMILDAAYLTADSYLKALADKTGGRLLRADTLASLPEALARIVEELRTQYSIGYYPTNSTHDGQYRKIKINTSRKNVVVRARPGYRAPSN